MLGSGPDEIIIKERLEDESITNVIMHGHIGDREHFNKIIQTCKFFIA